MGRRSYQRWTPASVSRPRCGSSLGCTCRRRARKATAACGNRTGHPNAPQCSISTAPAPASSAGHRLRMLFFGCRERSTSARRWQWSSRWRIPALSMREAARGRLPWQHQLVNRVRGSSLRRRVEDMHRNGAVPDNPDVLHGPWRTVGVGVARAIALAGRSNSKCRGSRKVVLTEIPSDAPSPSDLFYSRSTRAPQEPFLRNRFRASACNDFTSTAGRFDTPAPGPKRRQLLPEAATSTL